MSNPTRPTPRRLVAVLVAATIITPLAILGGPTRPAAAAVDGPCPGVAGVTVVIDFQELGGGVVVRCAPGASPTGLAALEAAGITYRTAVRSPGFVCRISDKPATDPCINTSPTSAYWSYWVASRGGPWCYSSLGAGNRRPPEGTVEGWSFSMNRSAATAPPPSVTIPGGNGGGPSVSTGDCTSTPPPPTTLPTPPTTAPPRPPGDGSPAATARPAAGASAGSPVAPGRRPSPQSPASSPGVSSPSEPAASPGATSPDTTAPVDPEAPVAVAGASAVAPTTTAANSPRRDEVAAGAAHAASTGGSPAGLVAGGVLVVALAGAAIVVRRRARSA